LPYTWFLFSNPNHHLRGNGCSKCGFNISKLETEFLDFFNISNRQKYIKEIRIKVDGYDVETNTVYEFLGDYWHGNPKIFNLNEINQKIKNI